MKHTTRRRFFELVPVAGTALIAACSPAPSPAPASAPAEPAPAPSPAAATPAPQPTSSPSSSAAQPAPASGAAPSAAAASGQMVDETDPQAVALSYVSDAARVDKAKAPNFVPGSHCGNCALYQGGTADTGPCPLYPGKRVAAGAWCGSWTKKA